MIRQGEAVFVDSGAWIALALLRDPLHERAREQWGLLRAAGARLHTSVRGHRDIHVSRSQCQQGCRFGVEGIGDAARHS